MLNINPEFKSLIPPLSTEEYEELEESITTYGCRDAIVIWNDTIIDGHNRFKICCDNDVAYQTMDMTYDFDTEDEVKAWIIRNQFGRRNIDKYQRSKLALQLKDLIAGKAKENQIAAGENYGRGSDEKLCQISDKAIEDMEKGLQKSAKAIEKPIDTREELAKIAGVSHDTIHKVETIESKAPEPVKKAAQDNVISINKAYEITKEIETLPEDKQETEAVRMMNERTAKANKEIDRRYNLSKAFANAVESIGTHWLTEEALDCYLEYSPQVMIDDLVKMCDTGISNLQQIKAWYTARQKPKVVK